MDISFMTRLRSSPAQASQSAFERFFRPTVLVLMLGLVSFGRREL